MSLEHLVVMESNKVLKTKKQTKNPNQTDKQKVRTWYRKLGEGRRARLECPR